MSLITISVISDTDNSGWLVEYEVRIMMGIKERTFAPLGHVSIEELVPRDHFYRHVDRTLDLRYSRTPIASYTAGLPVLSVRLMSLRMAVDGRATSMMSAGGPSTARMSEVREAFVSVGWTRMSGLGL